MFQLRQEALTIQCEAALSILGCDPLFNSIPFNYQFTEHGLHALMVSQYPVLFTVQTGYVMGEMNRNNMDKENEKYMGYQD